MHYSILVFNYQPLDGLNENQLRQRLKGVNFVSLCEQYQLDPTWIEKVKSNLEVLAAKDIALNYFLINYGGKQDRPIVVYEWGVESVIGERIMKNLLNREEDIKANYFLLSCSYILEIELGESQLRDIGLLLGYEIARWGADEGEGIVLGLDRRWYQLNRHKAFIHIEQGNL